jgi:hypothetical protein
MNLWLDDEVYECGGWILWRVLKKLERRRKRERGVSFKRREECDF